ncbi:hypothetical protein ABZP36_020710 [Zizania latifolia]
MMNYEMAKNLGPDNAVSDVDWESSFMYRHQQEPNINDIPELLRETIRATTNPVRLDAPQIKGQPWEGRTFPCSRFFKPRRWLAEPIKKLPRGINTASLGQSVEQVAGAAAGPEVIPIGRGGEDTGGEQTHEIRIEKSSGGGEEGERVRLEERRHGLEDDGWGIGGRERGRLGEEDSEEGRGELGQSTPPQEEEKAAALGAAGEGEEVAEQRQPLLHPWRWRRSAAVSLVSLPRQT